MSTLLIKQSFKRYSIIFFRSSNGSTLEDAQTLLIDLGVQMFSVGVGTGTDKEELKVHLLIYLFQFFFYC